MALGPVAQIHVSVSDIDASVAFYRDVLGIPLLLQVTGQPMAFFASGDVRLYLGVPETPEFASRCCGAGWRATGTSAGTTASTRASPAAAG